MKCHINIYIHKYVDDYVKVAGNVNKLFFACGKIYAVNKYMQYGCINNTGMKKA